MNIPYLHESYGIIPYPSLSQVTLQSCKWPVHWRITQRCHVYLVVMKLGWSAMQPYLFFIFWGGNLLGSWELTYPFPTHLKNWCSGFPVWWDVFHRSRLYFNLKETKLVNFCPQLELMEKIIHLMLCENPVHVYVYIYLYWYDVLPTSYTCLDYIYMYICLIAFWMFTHYFSIHTLQIDSFYIQYSSNIYT